MKASLDDIYLFMLTVRHGGISAAAKAHSMQRSKISRRIQELEQALGCQLLIRTTRQIELTENGRLFYQYINQPLNDVTQAVSLLENQQHAFSGRLKIAIPAAVVASPVFLDLLDSYSAQFPDVTLDIVHRHESVDLKRENIDLQLLPNVVDVINDDYVQQTLLSSSNRLYCSPKYLESSSLPTTMEELYQHPILSSRYTSALLPDGMNLRLVSEDFGLIKLLTETGRGIALLPIVLFTEQVERGELIPVMHDTFELDIVMTLVYPSRHFIPEKTRAMIELLRNNFSNRYKFS
ncbi:LysR family transcriptional regulator [Photobacterium leiognathi]|uniref:LysR family transcriptional regulator n=1 Tax=Photobacterium leiognathi TaxID=553611 RepID=UPI001EDD14A2|nr:LysR family transcriptional regulator [Photobacterium leiognathi]MCG3884204.1 LysR family transcriptional regulator [Photobacterium leiognathi]